MYNKQKIVKNKYTIKKLKEIQIICKCISTDFFDILQISN